MLSRTTCAATIEQLSPTHRLLLHLALKGPLIVKSETASIPQPSGLARKTTQELLPMVADLQRVDKALESLGLSQEQYQALEDARERGIKSIIETLRALVDIEPTCVAYTSRNEFVVSLNDEQEFALYEELTARLPPYRYRKDAHDWMIERGDGDDLDNLPVAFARATTDGAKIPLHHFGLLRTFVVVRSKQEPITHHEPRPPARSSNAEQNLLRLMRNAVVDYEQAAGRLAAHPEDSRLKREHKDAQHSVIKVMLLQAEDADTIVRVEEDGSHSCNLGNGDEVNVLVVMDKTPSRKQLSPALVWLKRRGKKRRKALPDELWRAFDSGEVSPNEMFGMPGIEIKRRRKR